jgi:hypothetical protein
MNMSGPIVPVEKSGPYLQAHLLLLNLHVI